MAYLKSRTHNVVFPRCRISEVFTRLASSQLKSIGSSFTKPNPHILHQSKFPQLARNRTPSATNNSHTLAPRHPSRLTRALTCWWLAARAPHGRNDWKGHPCGNYRLKAIRACVSKQFKMKRDVPTGNKALKLFPPWVPGCVKGF